MATTHTFQHGLGETNSSHVEGAGLYKPDREERNLYIVGVMTDSFIAVGMLVGTYFLLW